MRGASARWPIRTPALALIAILVVACATGGVAPASPAAAPSAPGESTPPATTAAPPTPSSGTASPGASATRSPAAAPSAGAASGPPDGPPAALEWREIVAPAGPGPREDHTWTVDPATDAAYLFGGRRGRDASDELWRYELASDTWSLIEPAGAGPAARFGHVAAWVEGFGLVIWSGQAGPNFFDDLWAYDPAANAWTELPARGDVPPARYGSCGGIGPDGRLWISHGFTQDAGRFSDTRAYDFAGGAWADVTPANPVPVVRCLHDCLWTPDGNFLIYAGQTTGVPAIGDLWSYSPGAGAWTEAPDPEPPARQLYALAKVDGWAFVFGGSSRDGDPLGDLWRLDLSALTWAEQPVDGGPPARYGATLIADDARGRLLLFGGKADDELADLWALSTGP